MKTNKNLQISDVFILRNYDGAEGTRNTFSQMITTEQKVADEWCKITSGNDYVKYTGVLVNTIEDFLDVEYNIERAKALSKLTDREKKILGFDNYGNVVQKYR